MNALYRCFKLIEEVGHLEGVDVYSLKELNRLLEMVLTNCSTAMLPDLALLVDELGCVLLSGHES